MEDIRNLRKPNSHKAEMLLHIIKNKRISLFDFPYLASYRTRLSEIRKDLLLTRSIEKNITKFGNTYTYTVYTLEDNNVEKAINLYKTLNK